MWLLILNSTEKNGRVDTTADCICGSSYFDGCKLKYDVKTVKREKKVILYRKQASYTTIQA